MSMTAPPPPITPVPPGSLHRLFSALSGHGASDADPAEKEALLQLLGRLRDIRANAQDLLKYLADFQDAANIADPTTRASQVQSRLRENQPRVIDDAEEVVRLFKEVHEIFTSHGALYDWCGDAVTRIKNEWERAGVLKLTESELSLQLIVGRFPATRAGLEAIVDVAARLTIPSRLSQYLSPLPIGRALNFNAAFKDELSDATPRSELLLYLNDRSFIPNGLVDPASGMFFRAARRKPRRWMSVVVLIGAALIGVLLTALLTRLGSVLGLASWPADPSRLIELLAAYLFLLIGAVAHITVNALKQSRSESTVASLAFSDFVLWLHVHEVSNVRAVGFLWLALVGLAWTSSKVEWSLAFFVGYSIDSVIGIFLDRFSAFTSAGAAAAQNQLRGAKP